MDTQSTDLLFNHPKRPRRFDTTSEVETARVGAHVDLHLAMEKRNPLRRGGTWGDCGSDKTRTAVGTGLGFHLGCGAAMWCWVCYPVIVHCSRTGVCIHVAPPQEVRVGSRMPAVPAVPKTNSAKPRWTVDIARRLWSPRQLAVEPVEQWTPSKAKYHLEQT